MNILLFLIFFFADYSHACEAKNIICNTVCQHDNDEMGVVINGKCYCANYRDITKFITKVPKHGRMVQTTPPPRPWE